MNSKPRLHYAWVVAATTFVLLLFSSSTRGVFSLLIGPLMKEFGWSRSATSLSASVNLIVFGCMGPFAASLMARFGLRSVVSVALGLVATGALFSTQAREPWQMVLSWGLVAGVGMGGMASVLASTVANTWFVAKRGQVTGLLMAATTAGTLLFMRVNAALIDARSWRYVCIVIALATLAGIPLALAFIWNKPEDKGTRAYGSPEGHVTAPRPTDAISMAFQTLGALRGSGMFWILFGGFWVCGVTTSGMIQTHWYESAGDHGISRGVAANLLMVMGVCDLLGSLTAGALVDRVDPRKLLFGFYLFRGISLLFLDQVLNLSATNPGLILIIVFYGLDWVATVPPTIALANELFGVQRGGIVYGWLFAAHQLGGFIAAQFAAATRDWTGSYQLSYIVGAGLCLVAAVGCLGIGRTPYEGFPNDLPRSRTVPA